MSNDIVLFEAKDGSPAMPVQVKAETVWLNMVQMAALFGKDRSVVLRHIHNAIDEGEIDPKVTCAKFAQVTPHGAIGGKTRTQIVDYYNLDVIISVGYRVKSQRGVEFRRWATRVLKEYIVRGYALNRERLKQLGQALEAFVASVNGSVVEKRIGKGSHNPRSLNYRIRFQVLQRDGYRCCACGASPAKDPGVVLHIDHIVPVSHGGSNELKNLQTLCEKCNLGKSDLM